MIAAIGKSLLIALFIALAASIRFARSDEQRRKRVTLMIGYVVAVQLCVAAFQREVWPFVTYRWLYGRAVPDTIDMRNTIVAIDRDGRNTKLRESATAPLSPFVLDIWMTHAWPQLSAKEQQQALHFLQQRAGGAALQVISEYRSISTRDPWRRGRVLAELPSK